MKRSLFSVLFSVVILLQPSQIIFASSTSSYEANEITREEVLESRPEITPREATISMLLNGGWTMEEIDEWYTEEALSELDENAVAISNSAIYTVNHENTETGEVVSERVSRQQFDYGVNKVECDEEEHSETELSTLSSNGVLELQPIYGWDSMNHITANDRVYFGTEGYSGSSIWNADSECYLKQNMGLVWMSNDRYKVQYRFEWMTEPYYTLNESFAIALTTGLIVHENPNEYLALKYSINRVEFEETLDSTTYTHVYCSLRNLSQAQGRQVNYGWPKFVDVYAQDIRGFLSFDARINEKYTYQQFIAYAQYYHGKLLANSSADISFSFSGASANFSISPSIHYITESHPMEVRAYNKYMN